jgi:hypothetical protein
VADKIKRELNIEPEMVHGKYGEYKVLVGNVVIIDAGPKVILGIFPSANEIIGAEKKELS